MDSEYYMVIGSGRSIQDYKDQILDLIQRYNPTTIGVNNMTSLCYPNYHLWTNKRQYSKLGSCINPKKSKMLFGSGMRRDIIRKHHKGKFEYVKYTDKRGAKLVLEKGKIRGYFRTAGVLAIGLSYTMGAKRIDVVGMDGYTLYSKENLKRGRQSQHCYGKGKTDDASWKDSLAKDEAVYDSLRQINAYGLEFRIITPTKFEDYYDNTVL